MISVCARLSPMTSALHFFEICEIIDIIRIAITIGIYTTFDSHDILQFSQL